MLGGRAEYQATKRLKLYGNVTTMDTSHMNESLGTNSITQAAAGLVVNFK